MGRVISWRAAARLAAASALLASAIAATTCSNPVDLVEAVTVEVMKGNDRFLEVLNFSPANNTTQVSPSSSIWVEFDRPVDADTVTTDTIDISPAVPWTFSCNDATNTLYLQPAMGGATEIAYTVSLKTGLKGQDGRSLFEARTWSFETKIGPSGTVSINAGAKYATASSGNTLHVEANSVARKFRYGQTVDVMKAKGWTTITTTPFDVPAVDLTGGEGTNAVYIQFWDDALDFTSDATPISDTIVLDTVPPAASSFAINGGANGTSSSTVMLSQAATDATSGVRLMQFMNYGGSWSGLEKYAATKDWSLAASAGTRQVSVRFQDAAGNISSAASDSIVYGAPNVASASLNGTAKGTVTVSWSASSADSGTNYYYVYRRDYPSGSTYAYLANTTASSLNVSVPQGSLYFFHVAIYNSTAGGVGPYSSTCPVGYTSDIAIIYGADEAQAAALKATLANSNSWISGAGAGVITGSMPTWTVTLVPESVVSSTYASANVLYGYPVIVTDGTSLYSYAGKVRNVTAHGKGVVAMGAAGARLLDVVSTNFASWGYSGTSPSEIGWGPSAVESASVFAYTWTGGNSVWSSPLACPPHIPASDVTSVQLAYTSVSRVCAYRASNTNPANGWLYGRGNYDHYFPVARQDRFLQYGFYSPPLDRFTGKVYTVNLVHRMGATYYP